MPDGLLEQFDRLIEAKGYDNRSEALRDLVRQALVDQTWVPAGGTADRDTVAVLVIVYDHEERELGRKLTHAQHGHVGSVLSSLHIHLDERHCLEVIVLRGPRDAVRQAAEGLVATRGVKFGRIVRATTGEGL
jgi:CopG family nickel-responsive transcriptional regulator